MIDNRLEYIGNLKDGVIEKMSHYRKLFIALDNELIKLGEDQVGHRQLAIARTNLESSLMYAIKTIAIAGEKK